MVGNSKCVQALLSPLGMSALTILCSCRVMLDPLHTTIPYAPSCSAMHSDPIMCILLSHNVHSLITVQQLSCDIIVKPSFTSERYALNFYSNDFMLNRDFNVTVSGAPMRSLVLSLVLSPSFHSPPSSSPLCSHPSSLSLGSP